MTWTGRCGTSSSRGRGSGRAGGSGFPRFKKRGQVPGLVPADRGDALRPGTVTLPRLGVDRTHESTRKLARRLEDGTARILSATVSRTAQRWFVSFTVEVERAVPERHARPGTAVGIDLGRQDAADRRRRRGHVITVPGPKPLRRGAAPAAAGRPRALPQAARVGGPPQVRRPAGPPARPRRQRPRRRAAQGHHDARRPVRDGRGRGPERGRDDPQPPPGPRHLRPGVRDRPGGCWPTRPPGTAGRWSLADRWYPSVEDVLGLRHGESQAGPVRADLPVRRLRPGPGPGRERRPEPAVPRRQWGGEAKRLGRDCKTRPRAGTSRRNRNPAPRNGDKTGTAARQQAAAA